MTDRERAPTGKAKADRPAPSRRDRLARSFGPAGDVSQLERRPGEVGRIVVRAVGIVLATVVLFMVAGLYPWLERRHGWFDADWRNPWMLLGLLLVPLIWWWGTFGQDRRRPRLRMGNVTPLRKGPRGRRAWLRDVPGVLRAVAVSFLVLAIARPVLMLTDQSSEEKGIDIVLVMDLSGSMRAVLDADPRDLPWKFDKPPNRRLTRLDTAKIVVQDFISRRSTDRIGVIVFGKAAYILSPPTLDYQLLTQLVSKMSLQVIDGGATAIGDALGTAAARLRRSDALSKVIILLTDGDNNAGSVSPEYAVELANSVGAKCYTIQIGSGDEVEVQDGVDLFGNPRYVRHRFPVNPQLLQRIAEQTKGKAYIATDAKGLAQSMHSVLDQLEKTRFEASVASYEELFFLLLLPGVLLIGLDALLRAWLLRRFP